MKKYYSLNNILKTNSQYNLIIGERSNGKSYAVQKLIVENYLKTGKQGGYIRRWKDDFTGKRSLTMFDGIVKSGVIEKLSKGKFTDISFYRGAWYLTNDKIKDDKPFCYAFSLSDVEHDKSTSYPNINIICFDEFITRGYYMVDEFIIYMNVLSTIIRDKDNVKIFMLGNTVNKFCPYFSEMGLSHIQTMQQGTIDIYKYGDSGLKVAVEYCASTDRKSKKSDIYFSFDNPKLQMIKTGAWEIDSYPHLPEKYKPKDVIFNFFIVFDNNTLQGDVISLTHGIFVYIHRKTSELKEKSTDIIYDGKRHSDYNHRDYFTTNIDKIDNKLYNLFNDNKFFYQDNETGEIFSNYMKEGIKNGNRSNS